MSPDAKFPDAKSPDAKPVRTPGGPSRPGAAGAGSKSAWRAAVRFLGSYGLSVSLLCILMVLTFLGTIEQARMSLYDVQKKYFETWILTQEVGPLHVPIPGAVLVLSVLSVNLLVGGILRLRKGWNTAGVLVIHLGMLLLFAGGLVEYRLSDKGQMTLYEGEREAQFQSYYEWEVAIRERKADGTATEHVLGYERIEGLSADDRARFRAAGLPFDLVLSQWVRNGLPEPGGSPESGGWVIRGRDPAMEAEQNMPGGLATIEPRRREDRVQRTWLWGGQRAPWVVRVDGRTFDVDLRKRSWPLPFTIELTRFVAKFHPGTGMASEYSSYVKKEEGTGSALSARDVHITMNEPLRHKGYTLYQSGWGPQGAPPGTKLFSTFAVVRNPSDRVPIIACTIIGLGLTVHFLRKLLLYMRAESRKAAAAAARAPAEAAGGAASRAAGSPA